MTSPFRPVKAIHFFSRSALSGSSLICRVILILLFFSVDVVYAQPATTAIYVGNQGNFSDANGSVSLYTPASGNVSQDVIPNLNTLVQNITIHENAGYILANTSDRIDIFDLTTNARTGQIMGVASPRFLTMVSADKAYVSNLFSNTVTVLDLTDNTIAGAIDTGANPEDIAVLGSFAYVANNGFGFDSTLTQIDISMDAVASTISLECDGPRTMEVSRQAELWVVCSGKTVYNSDFTEIIEQTNGQVVVLDSLGAVVTRFEMDAQLGTAAAGQDSFYDIVTDQLFVVEGNRVMLFDTALREVMETIEIPGDEPIGGIAYDVASDEIYAARIPGYTTAGFVSIHDMAGMEVDRFEAGIAPTTLTLVQTGISVANEASIARPGLFTVFQNYPNPFRTATTIAFEIDKTAQVAVDVFNVLGAKVATPRNQQFAAGRHQVTWEADNLPAGVYFYRITAGDAVTTRKMILQK